MSQTTRPISDVSNSGWTPIPLYPQINEPVPNDSTQVVSSGGTAPDEFVVQLSDVSWPKPGDQTFHVRWVKGSSGSGAGGLQTTAELLQGDTVIARSLQNAPSVITDINLKLTEDQKRAIRYDEDLRARNLKVRIAAVPPISTGCCTEVMRYLTASIINKTGTCGSLPDKIDLDYTGTSWSAGGITGGLHLVLTCQSIGSGSAFRLACQPCGSPLQAPDPGWSCNPLSLTFQITMNLANPNRPCDGSITVVVTNRV